MTSKSARWAPASLDRLHDNRWCTVVDAVGIALMRGNINTGTRTIASTLGVLVGIGSIDHGILECLQGFRPTPDLLVYALGSGYRWTVWKQGGEGALTLIPNFLLSGIIATLLGLPIIVWSLRFIASRRGPPCSSLLRYRWRSGASRSFHPHLGGRYEDP